jgi:hypothetical protein
MRAKLFWAALSRAARTPDNLGTAEPSTFGGFPGPGGIPVLIGQVGNRPLKLGLIGPGSEPSRVTNFLRTGF